MMQTHRSRILLMEDDPALASRVIDLLLSADCEVDGPYVNVSDGMAALATHFPDGAIVDLRGQVEEAALLKDDLEAYDIPFLGRECAVEARLLPWLLKAVH